MKSTAVLMAKIPRTELGVLSNHLLMRAGMLDSNDDATIASLLLAHSSDAGHTRAGYLELPPGRRSPVAGDHISNFLCSVVSQGHDHR